MRIHNKLDKWPPMTTYYAVAEQNGAVMYMDATGKTRHVVETDDEDYAQVIETDAKPQAVSEDMRRRFAPNLANYDELEGPTIPLNPTTCPCCGGDYRSINLRTGGHAEFVHDSNGFGVKSLCTVEDYHTA